MNYSGNGNGNGNRRGTPFNRLLGVFTSECASLPLCGEREVNGGVWVYRDSQGYFGLMEDGKDAGLRVSPSAIQRHFPGYNFS